MEGEVGMDFWTALRDAFGSQAVDLRDRLLTDGSYAGRNVASIRRIVVHHTAVDASRTWAAVAAYHVNGNNWPGIGYHLGITGRQVTVVGHRDVGATACPGDRLYAALFAPREPLPNDEPAATAEKLRWWLEECARQFEAHDAERTQAILYSLIALAYRLEQVGREKE